MTAYSFNIRNEKHEFSLNSIYSWGKHEFSLNSIYSWRKGELYNFKYGPADIWENGNIYFKLDGGPHRLDGPASITKKYIKYFEYGEFIKEVKR